MAGSLKEGDEVHTRADKIRFPNWCADNLGRGWRTMNVNGVIVGTVGEGRKKQFLVRWSHPTDETKTCQSEQTSRSLNKGKDVRPTEAENGNSSDKDSIEEEILADLSYCRFEEKTMKHGEFTELLSFQLISNKFDGYEKYETNNVIDLSSSYSCSSLSEESHSSNPDFHEIVLYSSVKSGEDDGITELGGRKLHRGSCRICSRHAYFFCKTCSGQGRKPFFICGTNSKDKSAKCIVKHVCSEIRRSHSLS